MDIFINYRRIDTQDAVDKICSHLKVAYGDSIFLDSSEIPKGGKISQPILDSIAECKLFLPVIGAHWDASAQLKRLQDEDDWVRREIEEAYRLKKYIIPILIDRNNGLPAKDGLPSSLAEILFDLNFIPLSNDRSFWQNELSSLYHDIEQATGLKPKKQTIFRANSLDEHYKKLTYCLDRQDEIETINTTRESQPSLFSASGNTKDTFEKFAQRCCLKSNFPSILPNANLKKIALSQLKNFDKAKRQQELLDQISKHLTKCKAGNMEAIKNELKTGQDYVFYTISYAEHPRKRSEMFELWWDTWNMLLDGKQNPKILVLLCTIPSYWQRRLAFLYKKPVKHVYIGHLKDRINKTYVYDWQESFEVHLQNSHTEDAFDLEKMQSELKSNFPLRQLAFFKNCQYEQALEKLQKALLNAYKLAQNP